MIGYIFLLLGRHFGLIWFSRNTARAKLFALLIVFGLLLIKIVHLIDSWPFVLHGNPPSLVRRQSGAHPVPFKRIYF